jgi:hypothetical protein
MKLTIALGTTIAKLFNSICVARAMMAEAEQAKDVEKVLLWLESEYEAATALVNLGVPVVGYEQLEKHYRLTALLAKHRADRNA